MCARPPASSPGLGRRGCSDLPAWMLSGRVPGGNKPRVTPSLSWALSGRVTGGYRRHCVLIRLRQAALCAATGGTVCGYRRHCVRLQAHAGPASPRGGMGGGGFKNAEGRFKNLKQRGVSRTPLKPAQGACLHADPAGPAADPVDLQASPAAWGYSRASTRAPLLARLFSRASSRAPLLACLSSRASSRVPLLACRLEARACSLGLLAAPPRLQAGSSSRLEACLARACSLGLLAA